MTVLSEKVVREEPVPTYRTQAGWEPLIVTVLSAMTTSETGPSPAAMSMPWRFPPVRVRCEIVTRDTALADTPRVSGESVRSMVALVSTVPVDPMARVMAASGLAAEELMATSMVAPLPSR